MQNGKVCAKALDIKTAHGWYVNNGGHYRKKRVFIFVCCVRTRVVQFSSKNIYNTEKYLARQTYQVGNYKEVVTEINLGNGDRNHEQG